MIGLSERAHGPGQARPAEMEEGTIIPEAVHTCCSYLPGSTPPSLDNCWVWGGPHFLALGVSMRLRFGQ